MRIYIKSIYHSVLVTVSVLFLVCVLYVSVWRWSDLKKSLLKSKQSKKFSIAELMGSTNVFEVVQPNISTIILEPSMPFLKHGRTKERRPFAVIVVTSMAKSFSQRHAIRSTWYKWADELNIRVFFMIGYHDFAQQELFHILEDEQRIYDDLIIDEYEEGYYKLPGKVLRMLKWYNSTYTKENAPRFFVKTDQDVFINLPNLVSVLRNTSYYKNLASSSSNVHNVTSLVPDKINLAYDPSDPETYFIGGKRFENPKVESDPDSKWYIDSSERERMSWAANLYPTYTNGPCYIISGNLVNTIYETSFSVPIYPFEDVYIVGMIAYDRLNLYISNLNEMWLDKSYISNMKSRAKVKKMLAIHPVEYPRIMTKICKRIPSCKRKLDRNSGAGKVQQVNQYLLAVVLVAVLTNLFHG